MIGELREAAQGKACPACGHVQASAGSCAVCGQPLHEPVSPEVANAINLGAALGQTGPTTEVELPEELAEFGLGQWSEVLHPRGGVGNRGRFRSKGGRSSRSRPAGVSTGPPRTPRGDAPKTTPASQLGRNRDLHGGSAEDAEAKRSGRIIAPPSPGPEGKGTKLSEQELIAQVGKGPWSKAVAGAVAALKSGSEVETEDFYRVQGEKGRQAYSPERVELHGRIARLLLQGAGSHPDPEAIFLAGGPASGKSTLVKTGLTGQPKDAVDVNPDIIKAMLPEYQALVAAGDPLASSKVHEESSHVSKMVMNLSILRRHHVVIDGTGNAGQGAFSGKIEKVRRAGYRVHVTYATIPTEEAVSRATKRGEKSGRVVPEGYLRSAHSAVSARYVTDVSTLGVPIDIYDLSSEGPVLVAQHDEHGRLSVKDGSLYDAFVEKARAAEAEAARPPESKPERAPRRPESAQSRSAAVLAGGVKTREG